MQQDTFVHYRTQNACETEVKSEAEKALWDWAECSSVSILTEAGSGGRRGFQGGQH